MEMSVSESSPKGHYRVEDRAWVIQLGWCGHGAALSTVSYEYPQFPHLLQPIYYRTISTRFSSHPHTQPHTREELVMTDKRCIQ